MPLGGKGEERTGGKTEKWREKEEKEGNEKGRERRKGLAPTFIQVSLTI